MTMHMIKKLSNIISILFAPLLTPTYGITAVFLLTPLRFIPATDIAIVISIVFLITGLLPGCAVYIMTRTGAAKDIELTRRKDRLFPYIMMAVALTATGIYLHWIGAQQWISTFFYGAAAAAVVNLLINFKWKISAHGAGIGGLLALFVILSKYALPGTQIWLWIIANAIITGILGAARVFLGRHTPLQTICGSIVGFSAVFIAEII